MIGFVVARAGKERKERLAHEAADNIAQRVLGNIEPTPGQSPEEYDREMEEAERAFRHGYPEWNPEKYNR